jgi:hypothetical protein
MKIAKKKIEARQYELLQLQLSLAKSNDESSQISSKYVTLSKVCVSIPEKVERWRRPVNRSGPEANAYGAQISHRAEGRHRI